MYLTKNKRSPYYQIVFERDGKTTTKSTKTKIKSEALKFLSEFERNTKLKPKIEIISLSEFREKYLDYLAGAHSKNYQQSVKVTFRQAKIYIGNPKLKDVSISSVDSFISKVYRTAPQSALSYYSILKAAFNKAVQWNYILNNPFNKIKAPRVKKSLPIFINESNFELILQHTKEPYLRDLFLLAFHSGLRLSEILSLQWNAISLKDRIITVKHTENFTTKSKKERIIPINKKLFDVLSNRYPIENEINKILGNVNSKNIPEYVFYRIKGVKLTVDFVSKKFKKSVRAAKLNDKIHFHTLRHSFASNLVQKGVSLYTVKELLGHSDFRITQIYSHLQHSNLFDAVELLAEIEIDE